MFSTSSGEANVIAVKACIRHNDHVVIVMPYFEHDRFQVQFESFCVEITGCLCCISALFFIRKLLEKCIFDVIILVSYHCSVLCRKADVKLPRN